MAAATEAGRSTGRGRAAAAAAAEPRPRGRAAVAHDTDHDHPRRRRGRRRRRLGRIANDVLTLGRPEIGELSEGTGGGSSTMPHKANPVLATLIRRAALTTPSSPPPSTAAAGSVDERADGGWHAEWATLRTLLRRTCVAGSQTTDLLAGLRVHPDRMRATLDAA